MDMKAFNKFGIIIIIIIITIIVVLMEFVHSLFVCIFARRRGSHVKCVPLRQSAIRSTRVSGALLRDVIILPSVIRSG